MCDNTESRVAPKSTGNEVFGTYVETLKHQMQAVGTWPVRLAISTGAPLLHGIMMQAQIPTVHVLRASAQYPSAGKRHDLFASANTISLHSSVIYYCTCTLHIAA